MLDPRLLRTIVLIADTASFTVAANRMNSTNSTASQHLSRLEAAVRKRLIDRTARPVRTTASGDILLGHARRLLELPDEIRMLLADPAGAATLRIG
ncbi:MAG: LysR family transcriptional regulator [Sphingorhabdus sp.]